MTSHPLESPPVLPRHELSSWKEIASYLGVSVKTAQLWERDRGLPVRRLPGRRGVVVASVSALETWKQATSTAPVNTPAVGFRRWYLLAVAMLLLAGGGVYVSFVRSGHLATCRLQENTLIVSDARGRELWRHLFAQPLEPWSAAEDDERVWIGDLGDGRKSVLFGEYPPAV